MIIQKSPKRRKKTNNLDILFITRFVENSPYIYNCISNAFKIDSSKSDLQTCDKQAYKMKEENRQYEWKKLCYFRYFAIDTDSFIRLYAHVNFHINRIRSFFSFHHVFLVLPSSLYVSVCFLCSFEILSFSCSNYAEEYQMPCCSKKSNICIYSVWKGAWLYWKSGKWS